VEDDGKNGGSGGLNALEPQVPAFSCLHSTDSTSMMCKLLLQYEVCILGSFASLLHAGGPCSCSS